MAVDQHTYYTVIAPCPSHKSQAVAKKIFKQWTRWAGPWDVLVCDGSLRDFYRKTLGVRNSGAKQEGSNLAKDCHHQGSWGQDDFATPIDREECHVCRQLRSCPRTEPKGREVRHSPSDTSFWPVNEGLWRTNGRRRGRTPS